VRTLLAETGLGIIEALRRDVTDLAHALRSRALRG
jgi:hypothetical protein